MIKIFIADDHAMVREGLKSIILNDKKLSVVGEAADGNETLKNIRKCETDVLPIHHVIRRLGHLFVDLAHHLDVAIA